jgi:hypothetical protein
VIMGLRLFVLGLWTPQYIIRRELENISNRTTAVLTSLIPKNQSKAFDAYQTQDYPTSIQEQRTAMARKQAELVAALESALGHDEAVQKGRKALFAVGQEIGKQTRSKLGVSENPADLAKAAKILYRVLGIEFDLYWFDRSNAKATITRCALARKYTELTCKVLSATDEGVINGLQPYAEMKFTQYMTSGCRKCSANIQFNKEETSE